MNTWSLEKRGFDPADAAGDGNRFLCANGYLGLRGVPEEAPGGGIRSVCGSLAGAGQRASLPVHPGFF